MSDAVAEKTGSQNAPARPTFRRGPNVIAVASGKGGVGKSWFSITLSHAIARSGKKSTPL